MSIYIDFDGTLCLNKLQHYQAFKEALLQLKVDKPMPVDWFGLTTHQVYESMGLRFMGITSDEFINLKRKEYKAREQDCLISIEIVRFLKLLPSTVKVEVFSNGTGKRIKAFLDNEGLDLKVFSFADIGLSKYNKEHFLRYFNDDISSHKLIIDDSDTVIDLCNLCGFKGIKFDPEKFKAEEAYEIYSSLGR
ncbi:hypothetical protein ACMXYW_02775 [Neptuniibacter sp. QD48_55]|uniref:hypothetical protein n=1 Tax=Neptuniibacter sp. QD48_55 TaxID=3398212 RepID=UPI0039F4F4E6